MMCKKCEEQFPLIQLTTKLLQVPSPKTTFMRCVCRIWLGVIPLFVLLSAQLPLLSQGTWKIWSDALWESEWMMHMMLISSQKPSGSLLSDSTGPTAAE